MANKVIGDYAAASTIDGATNFLLIQPGNSSTAYNKISRNILLGITGQPADISSVQTITNKIIGNTNLVTLLDGGFTLQNNTDTTKRAIFSLTGITTATTRTYSLPNNSSTLVDLITAQTLTNKTLTSPSITGGTIDNSTITVDAIAEHTLGNGVTVSGLSIKLGKLNTANSVITSNITDTAVTPAKLQTGTGTGWAWQTWTPSWTNLTVGNGIQQATYIQTGKTVNVCVTLDFGTTTTVSGSVSLTLPVTANATMFPAGDANFIGNAYLSGSLGIIRMTSTTAVTLLVAGASGTYASQVAISSTIPVTWGSSDALSFNFTYQAA